MNSLTPTAMPSAGELMEAGIKGWLPENAVERALEAHGIWINVTNTHNPRIEDDGSVKQAALWNQVYWSHQEMPAPEQALALRNRGILSDGQLGFVLQSHGFYTNTTREAVAHLRYEVPGPSDLVRFSVRHVFEPDLIKQLGYNDEYKPFLDIFHATQGLTYPIVGTNAAFDVKGMGEGYELAAGELEHAYFQHGLNVPTWAQCYWWAHWILPSPTQGYEMYFRLRPDRDRKFDPPFAKELNFDLESLNLLLRANDYPPYYRPSLAAIAHRIPGIRFLRQLRATDVYTFDDVRELFLRMGYSPYDAQTLAVSVEKNDRAQRRRSVESQARGQISRYWEIGIIDKAEVLRLLQFRGMTADEAQEAADLGDLDLSAKRAQGVIAQIKRAFVKGSINCEEAAKTLRQFGLTEDRIALYCEEWQLELKATHREISADKAVRWACRGIISLADLATRLTNLGYDAEDARGLVLEAQMCSLDRAARAAAEQVRERERSQRRLKQVQRDAQQVLREARRQLASHGSPAQLRKWFCEGHVGSTELYTRLRYLGWPDIDITRLISDCKSTPAPKNPPPKPSKTGNGQPPTGG